MSYKKFSVTIGDIIDDEGKGSIILKKMSELFDDAITKMNIEEYAKLYRQVIGDDGWIADLEKLI